MNIMKMMTKDRSSKWQLIIFFIIVPIIGIMTMAFSNSTSTVENIPSISPIKAGEHNGTWLSAFERKPFTPPQIIEKWKEKCTEGNTGHVKFMAFRIIEPTRIVATADGVVTNVGAKKGWGRSTDGKKQGGKVIVINHGNGYETWYYHMIESTVKLDDKIKQGEEIGHSMRAIFCYQVRKDGKFANPEDYIKE